jgi:hypothetical protein
MTQAPRTESSELVDMKRLERLTDKHAILLVVALLVMVLAASGPADEASSRVAGGGFEEPGTLSAAELLPPHILSGPEFVVDDAVGHDGEMNHYTVRSPLGDVTAAGRDKLEESIQELRALALLRATPKRTGAIVGFNQGLKKVAVAPYHTVKRVAFDPLYAIEAVPGEISEYAGRLASVGDLFKYGPRVFIRRSLGIDGARKALARRLHVDVHTDHDALRAELRRVGWGVWIGGLAPNLGEAYIDLELDLSTEVGSMGESNLGRAVKALRREVFPKAARRMLRRMDVPKDVTRTFRNHPHYSGSMREDLAVALHTMKHTNGRTDYVVWANDADSDHTARQVVRFAQVAALHHAATSAVVEFHGSGELLLIELDGERVVLPATHDHQIWNRAAAERIEAARGLADEIRPGLAIEMWSTGSVSPRLEEEFAALDVTVRSEVDRAYGPFSPPKRGLARMEQRYEHRFEEPIRNRVRNRLVKGREQRLVLKPLAASTMR